MSIDTDLAQLQAIADQVQRAIRADDARRARYKALVAERDQKRVLLEELQAQQAATTLAHVPSAELDAYHGIAGDSLLVTGYVWTWDRPDAHGRTFGPYDLQPAMAARKSFGGYPAVEWQHGREDARRRHGDVIAAWCDAHGYAIQMRVKAPRTPAEEAALRPGAGLSMTLVECPAGGYSLDSVSLTPAPAHPGARIVTSRLFR